MSQNAELDLIVRDKASNNIDKVSNKLDKSAKSADKTKKSLGGLEKEAERAGKQFGMMSKGFGIAFAAIGAAAVGAGIAIKGLAVEANKQRKLSDVYSRNADALKRMKDFAKEAGIEGELASETMLRLGKSYKDPLRAERVFKTIADAAKGNSDVIKVLTDDFLEFANKTQGLGIGDIEKLAKDAGDININDLYKNVASVAGKTQKEIENLAKNGTLHFTDLRLGFEKMNQTGGATGNTALTEAGKNIELQINRLDSIIKGIQTNIFVGLFGSSEEAAKKLKMLGDWIEKTFNPKNIEAFKNSVVDTFSTISPIIVGAAAAIGAAYASLGISALAAAGGLWAVLAPVLVAAAPFIAVGLAVAGVYYAFKNWDKIVPVIKDVWDNIKEFIFKIPEYIGFAIGSLLKFYMEIPSYIGKFAVLLYESIKVIGPKIWDFVKTLPETFMSLGKNIIQGLINGLTGAAKGVYSALSGIGAGIIKGFKKALGIASPSKVFKGFGRNISEGLALGIKSSSDLIPSLSIPVTGDESIRLTKQTNGFDDDDIGDSETQQQLRFLQQLSALSNALNSEGKGNSNLQTPTNSMGANIINKNFITTQSANSAGKSSSLTNNKEIHNHNSFVFNVEAGADIDEASFVRRFEEALYSITNKESIIG